MLTRAPSTRFPSVTSSSKLDDLSVILFKLRGSSCTSCKQQKSVTLACVQKPQAICRLKDDCVSACAKAVARDAKEMRNTQDTQTGFVSCKSARFYLFLVEKMRRFSTDEK